MNRSIQSLKSLEISTVSDLPASGLPITRAEPGMRWVTLARDSCDAPLSCWDHPISAFSQFVTIEPFHLFANLPAQQREASNMQL